MPGTTHEAKNVKDVIELVAEGSIYPEYTGSDVVVINLSDGRAVTANYCSNPIKIDASCEGDFFPDPSVLRELVMKLLAVGDPFVTRTGPCDSACTLQWTLRE